MVPINFPARALSVGRLIFKFGPVVAELLTSFGPKKCQNRFFEPPVSDTANILLPTASKIGKGISHRLTHSLFLFEPERLRYFDFSRKVKVRKIFKLHRSVEVLLAT